MEAKNNDVTTVDVSVIASTVTSSLTIPHTLPGLHIDPGELGTRTVYRHAIQRKGEPDLCCSLCMTKFNSPSNFSMHTCLMENLLSQSNVVFITDSETSAEQPQPCASSAQQTSQQIAQELVTVDVACSANMDAEREPSETHAKDKPTSSSLKLPILLPDFLKVKKDLEARGATQCSQCGRQFSSTEELVNHMKKHTGGEPFKCPECPSVFSTAASLNRHSKRHAEGKATVCSVCQMVFQSPDSCTAHMRTHYGKKAHVCEDCNKVFAYRKDYNVHRRVHSGERPYKCEECSASFAQKGHLSRHLRTHSGDRPHRCDECGATFAIRYRLLEHWRTHTKEKPYSCSICNASFSHLNTLKFHKRKHTGERPYQCQICNVKFSHQTHLKVHVRSHTGERPYKCDMCSASYSRKSLLVIHKRKHTGERPFKCTECSAAFAQSNYLRDHIRVHTGEKPFRCEVCHQSFSQRTSLRLHRKNHFNPTPKKSNKASKKEGNMIDRMISSLGRNKQQRTRQAKEAAQRKDLENGLAMPVLLTKVVEDREPGTDPHFVVVGFANVQDTGITEAEASQLEKALQHSQPGSAVARSPKLSARDNKVQAQKRSTKKPATSSPIKFKLIVTSDTLNSAS